MVADGSVQSESGDERQVVKEAALESHSEKVRCGERAR